MNNRRKEAHQSKPAKQIARQTNTTKKNTMKKMTKTPTVLSIKNSRKKTLKSYAAQSERARRFRAYLSKT